MLNFVKWVAVLILILFIGGAAGVVFDRMLMPWLSSFDSLGRFAFMKKANEKTTVINKTEQIIVREDFSLAKTAEKIIPSIVSVVSYQEKKFPLTPEQNVAASSLKNRTRIQPVSTLQSKQRTVLKTGLILTGDGLIMAAKDEIFNEKDYPWILKNQSDKTEKKEAPENSNQNQTDETEKVRIILSDEKEYEAKKVYSDNFSDLVFYKIEASNLSAVPLGNSDEIENSEKIVIIGNSDQFNFQNNFSSALIYQNLKFIGRDGGVFSSEKIDKFILSDGGVGGGNLGGAVIDFNGTLIGLASSTLIDGADDSNRKNVIIPVNSVKDLIDKVVQGKEVKRPFLGLKYSIVDRLNFEKSQVENKKGIIVEGFASDLQASTVKDEKTKTPAEKVGLLKGDMIFEVDKKELKSDRSFAEMIAEKDPGSQVDLKVLRDGKELEMKAVLE